LPLVLKQKKNLNKMANLRCDECGGGTNSYGSWDTPVKIICEKCNKENEMEKRQDLVIVLFEDDINKFSKDKAIEHLSVFDFNLEYKDIIRSSRISFVHENGEIVFKDRYGSLK